MALVRLAVSLIYQLTEGGSSKMQLLISIVSAIVCAYSLITAYKVAIQVAGRPVKSKLLRFILYVATLVLVIDPTQFISTRVGEYFSWPLILECSLLSIIVLISLKNMYVKS